MEIFEGAIISEGEWKIAESRMREWLEYDCYRVMEEMDQREEKVGGMGARLVRGDLETRLWRVGFGQMGIEETGGVASWFEEGGIDRDEAEKTAMHEIVGHCGNTSSQMGLVGGVRGWDGVEAPDGRVKLKRPYMRARFVPVGKISPTEKVITCLGPDDPSEVDEREAYLTVQGIRDDVVKKYGNCRLTPKPCKSQVERIVEKVASL